MRPYNLVTMIKPLRILCVLFGMSALWAGPSTVRAAEITVFAAASMTDAVTEIGHMFSRQSDGNELRYVFAASSTLARQIIAGAPAHVFISANAAWMHAAVDEGVLGETVVPIASNRLALIVASHRAQALPDDLPTVVTSTFPLIELLGNSDDNRLALGDPAHVPAGQYARQSLESLGFWHSVSARLAPMPHVRAALNLVVRNEVPLGIVYASDLRLAPAIQSIAIFPSESHLPITYLAGRVKSTADAAQNPVAQSFLSFLTSPEAAQVFQRHGFSSILSDPD
jgi:molybdate transport system substrate-binding protein